MTRVSELEQLWYKPTGDAFSEPLDKVHLARYRFAEVFCEGQNVLDVGCGAGYGSYALSQGAKSVLGIDTDPAAVTWARQMYYDRNLTYELRDVTEMREKFDIVVCFGVMQQLMDAEAMWDMLTALDRLSEIIIVDCPTSTSVVPLHFIELTGEEWEEVTACYPGYVERFFQRGDHIGQSWEVLPADYFIAILARNDIQGWKRLGFGSPTRVLNERVMSLAEALEEIKRGL